MKTLKDVLVGDSCILSRHPPSMINHQCCEGV